MATQKKKRAGAPRRATTASQGPVTLDEALALAQPKTPAKAARRRGIAAKSAALKLATPGTVAIERRKLKVAVHQENKRRISEYKAAMEIIGRRGLTDAKPAVRRGPAAAPKVIAQPLKVLAEGDSWFDYPVPLFGGGIIKRLQKKLGVPILNLAKAGDEVRFMLGVEERTLLRKHLTAGSPAGGKWDALLFSGGGNDIVDNPMALWIRDFDATIPIGSHIHQARFDAVLTLVRSGYEDLIEIRDRVTPGTALIFNAYDFAIPDGRGICRLGPWLKPTFDLRKFVTQAAAFEVVKAMLQKFLAMLQALAAAHPRVEVVDTQGTVLPVAASWHNELHPAKPGFDAFAGKFHARLKALFPDKVF
jgi:hypothetical protein